MIKAEKDKINAANETGRSRKAGELNEIVINSCDIKEPGAGNTGVNTSVESAPVDPVAESQQRAAMNDQTLQRIQLSLDKLRKVNQKKSTATSKGLVITRDINAENYVNRHIMAGILYERCKCCGSILIKRPVNSSLTVEEAQRNKTNSLPGLSKNLSVAQNFSSQFQTKPQDSRLGNDSDYRKYIHSKGLSEESDSVAAEMLDNEKLQDSSDIYKQQLLKKGCSGICILYDTGSCTGDQCADCENCNSDLCSKKYLLASKYANLLQEDGGDYRAVIGSHMKEQQSNPKCDMAFRASLSKGEGKALEFLEEVRQYILHADESDLLFQWKESTPKSFLDRFPGIRPNPLRIEVQMLLYIYKNYRLNIDIEHIEKRFHITRYTLNWYLKQSFGYSYSKLLSTVRNEQSKCLLMIPSLRIGEIGTLVGYHSNYHYSLSFKRLEGISPKEYREFALNRSALRRRVGDR